MPEWLGPVRDPVGDSGNERALAPVQTEAAQFVDGSCVMMSIPGSDGEPGGNAILRINEGKTPWSSGRFFEGTLCGASDSYYRAWVNRRGKRNGPPIGLNWLLCKGKNAKGCGF